MLYVFSGCFLTPLESNKCASLAYFLSSTVKIISHALLHYSVHTEQIVCKMEVLVLNDSMVNPHFLCLKKMLY